MLLSNELATNHIWFPYLNVTPRTTFIMHSEFITCLHRNPFFPDTKLHSFDNYLSLLHSHSTFEARRQCIMCNAHVSLIPSNWIDLSSTSHPSWSPPNVKGNVGSCKEMNDVVCSSAKIYLIHIVDRKKINHWKIGFGWHVIGNLFNEIAEIKKNVSIFLNVDIYLVERMIFSSMTSE